MNKLFKDVLVCDFILAGLKSFALWFALFAVFISTYNFMGYDDKGILFFITSPPSWILNDFMFFLKRYMSLETIYKILYILNLGFWFFIGFIIDRIKSKKNFQQIKALLKKIFITTICLGLGIMSFIIFYNYQNTESVITSVISNPIKYSNNNICYCLHRAAESDYGKNYVAEMELIAEETKDRDVYNMTISALSKIGNKKAVKAVVLSQNKYNLSWALRRNHKTIMSMLKIDESKDIIEAGIDVARILRYENYIEPLQYIIENIKDKSLLAKAEIALKEIKEKPKKRNPKWDID